MKKCYKRVLTMALSLFLIAAAGCQVAAQPPAVANTPAAELSERRSTVGFYFDTVVTLTANGSDGEFLETALKGSLALCAELEALLSKTVEGSDVWKVNHADGKPVTVDDRTRTILECALDVAKKSGGAFDPTIAPASGLWDFTLEEGEEPSLPDAQALEAAAELVDYTKLQLTGNTVTLPAGMQIDLGGIAKGYIADEVAGYFTEQGVKSAVINLGGNVFALGAKPTGGPWVVGLQDPDDTTWTSTGKLLIEGGTVVTSGIYERGFEIDGVRYHHLLDANTGWPIQNDLKAVSIYCDQSMLADALSTACFALGTDQGKALLETYYPGVEAVFITKDREFICTAGAASLFVEE